MEVEKAKAVEAAIATFMSSKDFEDATTEYYISGLEALCRRALREYLSLDLSMFNTLDDSGSVEPMVEVAEGAGDGEAQGDEATS